MLLVALYKCGVSYWHSKDLVDYSFIKDKLLKFYLVNDFTGYYFLRYYQLIQNYYYIIHNYYKGLKLNKIAVVFGSCG